MKFSKLELTALIIEGFTVTVGGALILSENHPYLSLMMLGIGSASHKVVMYYEKLNNGKAPKDSD